MGAKRLIIIFGLVAISLFIYGLFDPGTTSFFPKCPLHSLTGLDCPGCGSQRALHSLLNGDILKAADYNLLFVLCLPILAVHLYYKLQATIKKDDIRFKLLDNPLVPLAIFAVVILFTVLRNLPYPAFSFLAA